MAWLSAYPRPPTSSPAIEIGALAEAAISSGAAGVLAQAGAFPSARVQGALRWQAVAGIRALSVLRRLSGAFRAAQIPFIPLKGPILAARLYGDYTVRPTSDVDVLIRPSDFARARAAIEALGGHLEPSYAKDLEYHRRFHHNVGFALAGVLVEIHERASTHFGARFPSEPLIARGRAETVVDEELLLMDPVDEVIFLAVHAAGHYFPRDILLLDIRLLAARHGVDLREVERRAREIGVRKAVGAALVLAETRVGMGLATMSKRWRAASWAWLRSWPTALGTEAARDHRGVVLNLLADALWSDGAQQGLRFLGERAWYHLKQRTWGRKG